MYNDKRYIGKIKEYNVYCRRCPKSRNSLKATIEDIKRTIGIESEI
jgi:hypothetical protein